MQGGDTPNHHHYSERESSDWKKSMYIVMIKMEIVCCYPHQIYPSYCLEGG